VSRPRRLSTFDYRGPYVYSLTFCTFGRKRAFVDGAVVSRVVAVIVRTGTDRQFGVLAYTCMPDHLHLLVQARGEEISLPAFAKLVRQRTAMEARRASIAPIWQEGYYERTLRRDEDVLTVARYIANNPVRAGLIADAADWPFTGGTLLDAMFGRHNRG
jgi:REP element-mobilizing transposase RayT